jgi:hypothetical protein
MLACAHPAFDGLVMLFQDVVQILYGSVSAVGQIACGLELGNSRRITGVLVGIDYPRRRMVLPAQGFGQKALSRCCIAFGREKEVDGRPGGVYRAV